MENSQIELMLFSDIDDEQLIRFNILDAFNTLPTGSPLEGFFYRVNKTIENLKLEFEESRQIQLKEYKNSIKFNNENNVDNKFDMNSHNLKNITILKSQDYIFYKFIAQLSAVNPNESKSIKIKLSSFEKVEKIIKEIKLLLLESSKYNTRIQPNQFLNIFKSDLSYCIFRDFHEMFKNESKHFNANYSFIFLELEDGNKLLCNGKEFMKFLLDNFGISFAKIDYRKFKNKSKLPILNIIVDRLLYDL
jgi:hypothetical protein